MAIERVVSLISGNGTTMEHGVLATRDGTLQGIEYVGVISSDPTAEGVGRAIKLEIPVKIIDPREFQGLNSSLAFGMAINRELKAFRATLVTQNGWKEWTPDVVTEEYNGVLLNQHSGPLPETRNQHGIMPYATMLEFAKLTGRNEGTEVVVHRVSSEIDKGAIIGSRRVPILAGDTPQTLRDRGLEEEYALQVNVLNDFASGRLRAVPQEYHFMRPGEEKILLQARKKGRRDFPNG